VPLLPDTDGADNVEFQLEIMISQLVSALIVSLTAVLIVTADDGMILSLDESFLDSYASPFADENQEAGSTPPVVIVDNGVIDPIYQSGHAIIPEHTNYMALNMWKGSKTSLEPFPNSGYVITATPDDAKIISSIETEFFSGHTSMFALKFHCAAKGSSNVVVELKSEKSKTLKFRITKRCYAYESLDLLVSTKNGDVAFDEGEVTPGFNIHDLEGIPYIASREAHGESLHFHTYGRRFIFVGKPKVETFQVPSMVLGWILHSRPGLEEKFERYNHGDNGTSKGGTSDDYDDDDFDDYYDGEDDLYQAQDDEKPFLDSRNKVDQDKLPEVKSTSVLVPFESSDTPLVPSLGGEVIEERKVRIIQTKNHNMDDLKGFAGAGSLALHGGKTLELEYNCRKSGLAIIKLSFVVRSVDTKISEKIQLSWLKVCDGGVMHGSGESIDLTGFNIRLGIHANSDPSFFAVSDGIPNEAFEVGNTEMIATPAELTTTFYSYVSSVDPALTAKFLALRVSNVIVSVKKESSVDSDIPLMDPVLLDHGTFGYILDEDPVAMTVAYNCQRDGSAILKVVFTLDAVNIFPNGTYTLSTNFKPKRIPFAWTKKCSITPMKYLGAVTVNPKVFEDADEAVVVSVRGDKPTPFVPAIVVTDGVATNGFDSFGPSTITLAEGEILIGFKLFLQTSHMRQHGEILFNAPVLSVSNPDLVQVTLVDPSLATEMALLADDSIPNPHKRKILRHSHESLLNGKYAVANLDPVFFVVEHECHNVGTVDVTMEVSHSTLQQPLQLKWRKNCHFVHAQLSMKDTGAAVAFLSFLAILCTIGCFYFTFRRQNYLISVLSNKLKSRGHNPDGFEQMRVQ